MEKTIRIVTHMLIGFGCLMFSSTVLDDWRIVFAHGLTVALLTAFCCYIRSETKSLWKFLGLHMLLIAASVLATMLGAPKWYIAVAVLLVCYSLILRFVPAALWLDGPGYIYIGVMVLIYILLGIYGKIEFVKDICIWISVLMFLLKMLYENVVSMEEYVELRKLSAELDEKKVRHLSTQLTVFFVTVLGILLGLVAIISMKTESIWRTLGNLMKKITGFLLNLIFGGAAPNVEEELPKEAEKGESMADMLQGLVEEKEPSEFLLFIEKVLIVVVTVAIVVLLVIVMIRLAIFIYRYFYSRVEREDENQTIEVLDELETIPKERRKIFEGFERNPAKRIRKIYKKKMKRMGAKKIERFKFLTPEEQLEVLREQNFDEEAIEEIRKLYEKARYSNETITDSEASRLHTIM